MANEKVLKGISIAILATDGFEEIELSAPREEFAGYGANVHIVSDKPVIKSWKNRQWGNEYKTNRLFESFRPEDYDALILPGGVINTDRLRRHSKALEIVKAFYMDHKLIGAICHGPQILLEAGIIEGRTVTAHRAIETDLKNAGAHFEHYGVAKDGNIITARSAEDVSAFLKKILAGLMVTG